MAKENTVEVKFKTMRVDCYKCWKKTTIVITDTMWSSDPAIGAAISAKFPSFFLDFSFTIQTSYFMNHCENCRAKLGDWYLQQECTVPGYQKTIKHHKVIAKGLMQ